MSTLEELLNLPVGEALDAFKELVIQRAPPRGFHITLKREDMISKPIESWDRVANFVNGMWHNYNIPWTKIRSSGGKGLRPRPDFPVRKVLSTFAFVKADGMTIKAKIMFPYSYSMPPDRSRHRYEIKEQFAERTRNPEQWMDLNHGVYNLIFNIDYEVSGLIADEEQVQAIVDSINDVPENTMPLLSGAFDTLVGTLRASFDVENDFTLEVLFAIDEISYAEYRKDLDWYYNRPSVDYETGASLVKSARKRGPDYSGSGSGAGAGAAPPPSAAPSLGQWVPQAPPPSGPPSIGPSMTFSSPPSAPPSARPLKKSRTTEAQIRWALSQVDKDDVEAAAALLRNMKF